MRKSTKEYKTVLGMAHATPSKAVPSIEDGSHAVLTRDEFVSHVADRTSSNAERIGGSAYPNPHPHYPAMVVAQGDGIPIAPHQWLVMEEIQSGTFGLGEKMVHGGFRSAGSAAFPKTISRPHQPGTYETTEREQAKPCLSARVIWWEQPAVVLSDSSQPSPRRSSIHELINVSGHFSLSVLPQSKKSVLP